MVQLSVLDLIPVRRGQSNGQALASSFALAQVADRSNRAYAHYNIHNYFLGRAIDLVRPGGLVCLITSSHTMDAQYDAVREYIAAQAHLLGAIRLPKGTFAGIASTEVQTASVSLLKP